MSRDQRRWWGVLAAVGLFGVSSAMATSIQLSPFVGHQRHALYRAPGVAHSPDQYYQDAGEDYTIRLSNLRLSMSLILEAVYDDNVNLTSGSDEEEGLSLMPMLSTQISWPINPGFQVFSTLAIGYRYYLTGEDEADDDGLVVGGLGGGVSSNVGFDLKVGQTGTLTASDEFSRDIEAFDGGSRRNRDYSINRNRINLRYRNDFTEYTNGTAQATHTNQWSDESDYDEQNHYSDFIDMVLMTHLNRSLQAGPYVRAGMYRYTENLHNDSDELEGGLAVAYGTTQRLALSGNLGYSQVSFDTANNPGADDEYSGMTAQMAATYNYNDITTHRLISSYGAEQGTLDQDTNFSREWMTQYTIMIQLREDLLVNADLGYIDARESDGGENYDIYRTGIGLGYRLGRDTTLDLRYVRDWHDSDNRRDTNYTRNTVTLRLTHRL